MNRLACVWLSALAIAISGAALGQEDGDESGVTAVPAPLRNVLTRNLVLDLSVPESPAFDVLGFSPERVSRPTSPRELAANLLNGVDERGNLQTGIAIDATPYLLFKEGIGPPLTLAAYRDDPPSRVAARTQFSLGTTKGSSGEDKAVRLGAGLKTTLWDAGDPRMDDQFTACLMAAHDLVHGSLDDLVDADPNEIVELNVRFGHAGEADLGFVQDAVQRFRVEAAKEAVKQLADPNKKSQEIQASIRVNPGADVGAALEEAILRQKIAAVLGDWVFADKYVDRLMLFVDDEGKLQQAQTITRDCFAEAKRRNWNRPSWDVGGALSWSSSDGRVSKLRHSGGGVWTSLSLNLPDDTLWGLAEGEVEPPKYLGGFLREHFQLILHARYRPDQEVPDPSSTTARETVTQDSGLAGGRVRAGWPNFAVSAEGAYTYTKPRRKSGDSAAFYSVGAEYRIGEDLWLQMSIGSEAEKHAGNEEASVLASIKYGFSSSSPFEMWQTLTARTPPASGSQP